MMHSVRNKNLSVKTERFLVRAEGFEPPTSWFEARRSIQMSYARMGGRIRKILTRVNYLGILPADFVFVVCRKTSAARHGTVRDGTYDPYVDDRAGTRNAADEGISANHPNMRR